MSYNLLQAARKVTCLGLPVDTLGGTAAGRPSGKMLVVNPARSRLAARIAEQRFRTPAPLQPGK